MNNRKIALWGHWPRLLIIAILNSMVLLEPFLYRAKAAILDANAHILTIAQFHRALRDGEFPVMWADGFANYGLPLGTIAHQLPSYLGGLLTFVTHDPLISYYVLILIALITSSIGVYLFLIMVVSTEAALFASFIYTFATYRITNIFVRGAMPEIFMTIWMPYIIMALLKIKNQEGRSSYILLTILFALLILTHPMSLILSIPFILLITVYIFRAEKRQILGVTVSVGVAVALSAYYLIPLKLESKYLYMGSHSNLLVNNQSVDWNALFTPSLRYTCTELNYIFWRCADISFGMLEVMLSLSLTLGALSHMAICSRRDKKQIGASQYTSHLFKTELSKDVFVSSAVGLGIAFLMSSKLTEYLYVHFSLLGNIQIPSRFLSIYYFLFVVIIAFLYNAVSHKKLISLTIWCVVITLVVTLQFPQIYGKNYTDIPPEDFTFSRENYHGLMVQPKWTIDSMNYPVVPEKARIVSGKGTIASRDLKNASRRYTVQADTEVLISDHTFYFPGWNVYIDGNPTPIEFQDHAYRGVITFKVPPGTHDVVVIYQDTKIRRAGKYISLAACISLIVYGIFVYLYSRKTTRN